MAVPVLSWLGDNKPDTIAAAETVLACKDWIWVSAHRRDGNRSQRCIVDALRTEAERFDDSIAELTETPALSAMEPRVQRPTAVAGTITDIAAAEAGLPEGTPLSSAVWVSLRSHSLAELRVPALDHQSSEPRYRPRC